MSEEKECRWRLRVYRRIWESKCGEVHQIPDGVDPVVALAVSRMVFCPYCGKRINEV